jgi:hypothetical protein
VEAPPDVRLFTASAIGGGILQFTLSNRRWQILRDGVPVETGAISNAEFEAGLTRFHRMSSGRHAGTERGGNLRHA